MSDWQVIVAQHEQLVWHTVYRLVGNHADAADCAQEVFLGAVELARRQRVRDWSALFRRLATCRALDLLRRRYRYRASHEAAPTGPPLPVRSPRR